MKAIMIISLISVIGAVAMCNDESDTGQSDSYQESTIDAPNYYDVTFPFKATDKKIERIKLKCNELKYGMFKEEVSKLLGKPNLNNPIYNTIKRGEVVGESFFYLISQDKKTGSQKDKNSISIVVHFDLEGSLVAAYGNQVKYFKDLPKVIRE